MFSSSWATRLRGLFLTSLCCQSLVAVAGGSPPPPLPPLPKISCNGWQNDAAVANSGNAIKNFNGYGGWDSMVEILNKDGRQERFWLDSVPGQPYGKIRTTYALSQCTGFAWSVHQDFEGGLAKEMVAARLRDGRLIVAVIGTDGAFYWRTQTNPGSYWTRWNRRSFFEKIKDLKVHKLADKGIFGDRIQGIAFSVTEFRGDWSQPVAIGVTYDSDTSRACDFINSNDIFRCVAYY
jgi:hypothetical protein